MLLAPLLSFAACAGTCSGSIWCFGQQSTISCSRPCARVHRAGGHRGTAQRTCLSLTSLKHGSSGSKCVRYVFHSMSLVNRLTSVEKETTRCLQVTDLQTWSVRSLDSSSSLFVISSSSAGGFCVSLTLTLLARWKGTTFFLFWYQVRHCMFVWRYQKMDYVSGQTHLLLRKGLDSFIYLY